ncbi:MAG TPA: lanthionine synthetase LanC family protein [Thermoanaerobaculia bacterium]|jgi:lantibiotic modifying enzyme|nr:lanthionine synthetase LanC family protein [Thermoanaerobaculia bacterium]
MPISRRDLLRLSIAAGAASSLGLATDKRKTPKTPAATPGYLDAAVRAARWIRTARIETPEGYVWLSGPERPEGFDITPNLYTGSAGIVLFLLELARATGDKAHREEAVAGADALIVSLPEKIRLDREESGLYTGVAGLGFTLGQVFKETGDEKYRKAAVRCRDLIHAAAQPAGRGVEWGGVTDIIGGASGTGLYLLHTARTMDDSASRDLAVKAGLRLIELGIPEGGGRKWRMDPSFERLMPNFSHGTAGVAYYLATLHRETGRQEFLDAALAGARYLQAIANTEGDTCLIFHDEPDNKKLYYLGWCHGPVGTSRLWIRLDQIDGKAGWLNWAKKGAKGILASGIPEHQTPGFWNNLGQCCGSAGVADFFLDFGKLTGNAAYTGFARRVARNILDRATATAGDGLKWVHAEHRVKPEYVYAQTGYMQGAAGIGMLMLRMDGEEKGRGWGFKLPDDRIRRREQTCRKLREVTSRAVLSRE